MAAKEQRALELLTKLVPFLATGTDCLICGSDHDVPHEPDCYVPEIEQLTGRKSRS